MPGNATSGEAEESSGGPLMTMLGLVLALAAAAVVAFSMVLQRYALSYPEGRRVPLLCTTCKPGRAWGVGVAIYTAGNLLYTAALLFGPLSLLGGVFTM
mgnify:CR=1 FL=1|jgi:drug/metabolite transporter (DMT)-like permease